MSGYIKARPLCDELQKLRKEVDFQQTDDGVRVEDAVSILNETLYSLDKGYNLTKDYMANKSERNKQPQYGAVYRITFDEWSTGSEIRQVHPAVVITRNNMRSSDTIVVIPTTSASARRERILEKRKQAKDSWDDEAWCNVPVRANPQPRDVKFVDLKQIRVVSPARIEMENGAPVKMYTLMDECMADIEEALIAYFGLKSIKELETKLEKTLEAKRAADRKTRKLRRCILSVKSSLETMQSNTNLDPAALLTNMLSEIEEVLKL